MKKGTRLLSKSFIAIFIINMIGGAYGVMSLTTMVSYCLSLGFGDVTAGLVASILPMACFLFRPFSGLLCNRYGRNSLFYLGVVCYALPPLAFIFRLPLVFLLLARVVQGIGMALVTTTAGAIVVGVIPDDCFSAGIGIYSLGLTISGSISPGIALWLISSFGYNGMFLFTILISLAAGCLMPLVDAGKQPKQNHAGSMLSQLFERRSLIPTLFALAVGVIHVSFTQYLPIVADSSGVKGDMSLFYVMSTIAIILIRLLDVKLDRMLSAQWKLLIGFLGEIASGLLLCFFLPKQISPVWIGLIYGAGYSLVWTLLNVFAVDGIEESRQGSANATFLAASDLAYFIGPLFWSAVCSIDGYGHIYYVASAFMLLCLFGCLGMARQRSRRKSG